MSMKIAVLVNEDFKEMVLGLNSSLGYIVAAFDLGHDVYICKINENGQISHKIEAIFLNKNNAQILIDEFCNQNRKITKSLENQELPVKKLVKNIELFFEKREISFNEIDFVIQRLEPMKPPFPPFGDVDINDFLRNFSTQIFTKNKNYNLPIDCFGDKEFPLELDDENVAVPTFVSFLSDENMAQKARKIGEKIIIKPDNSAQAFGVFAVEFDEDGFDLAGILQEKISDFKNSQTFKIKPSIDDLEFRKMLDILFFVQDLKAKNKILNKKISEFTQIEIKAGAKALYGQKILIQPFIQGVKIGDIRIVLAKMRDGNFVIIGAVFRKNISKNMQNFATGIMSGSSIPFEIMDILSKEEQKDLIAKTNYVISQLNGKLRQKYENCYELGLDFLLFGDEKRVFLGEANHHCQGLIPLSEALATRKFYDKINGVKIDYDGGLGVAKKVILQWINNS